MLTTSHQYKIVGKDHCFDLQPTLLLIQLNMWIYLITARVHCCSTCAWDSWGIFWQRCLLLSQPQDCTAARCLRCKNLHLLNSGCSSNTISSAYEDTSGSPTSLCICFFPQFDVIHKFVEEIVYLIIQLTNKDFKLYWPHWWPWSKQS